MGLRTARDRSNDGVMGVQLSRKEQHDIHEESHEMIAFVACMLCNPGKVYLCNGERKGERSVCLIKLVFNSTLPFGFQIGCLKLY